MISVIVCSKENPEETLHRRNVLKTAGTNNVEYIPIDNRDGKYSLSAAYNEGVRRSTGEIIVFMHEDAFFAEGNWAGVLSGKFSDQSIGLVGVAGSTYLFTENPGWVIAGRPFIFGQVIHELNGGEVYNLTVFSWEKDDHEVVAVDGLFFAVRRDLFDIISFDEKTFDGFHCYDLDICMQVRRHASCIVTKDILVKHTSGGSFDEVWKEYALRFCKKYQSELPASCVPEIPDLNHRLSFENYNLKGRAPQVTIA